MIRILVSIKESEKQWLAKVAEEEHVSTSLLVRRAISLYRAQRTFADRSKVRNMLEKTKGSWPLQEDGLTYQKRLRDEW